MKIYCTLVSFSKYKYNEITGMKQFGNKFFPRFILFIYL